MSAPDGNADVPYRGSVDGGGSVGGGLPQELDRALHGLAATPVLLVASDFDGVLAPIVADPAAARPLPAAVAALRTLAAAPSTTVALVSGRALADLGRLSGLTGTASLVGSHGAETDGDSPVLEPDAAALRERLVTALEALAAGRSGVLVEAKPASVTLHVRNADRATAAELTEAVLTGPARWPGVHVSPGKEVVELVVVRTSKGTALGALRARLGATAVLYAGDDVTDETAFAALGDGDVGVKVGPGETAAAHRVADPADLVTVLETLARRRPRR